MRSFLIAAICVLCMASSAFAGPFGIFGNRGSSSGQSGCVGGNCPAPQQSSRSFNTLSSRPTYSLSAYPVKTTVVRQQALPQVVTKEEMPRELTINGVRYFRH